MEGYSQPHDDGRVQDTVALTHPLSISNNNNSNNNDDEEEDHSSVLKDEEEEEGLLFSCQCESARSVATLLSCLRRVSSTGGGGSSGNFIRHKRNHPIIATVYVNSTALTFHVFGSGRQSQASVDMQASLFSDYHVPERRIPITGEKEESSEGSFQIVKGGEFSINLSTVLECMQLLGNYNNHNFSSSTQSSSSSLDRIKLSMSYDLSQCIFQLELLEDVSTLGGSVLVTCAIPGMAVPDDDEEEERGLAVAFRSSPIVARCILESHILMDAMHELLDVPGAVVATLGISPRTGLEIIAVGNDRECHIALPNHPQIFVSFDCIPTPQSNNNDANNNNNNNIHANTYPLHSLLTSMKGLEIATETCISVNERGMMAIQHQVLANGVNSNRQPSYVDFIMTCMEEEEDNSNYNDNNLSFNNNFRDVVTNDNPQSLLQSSSTTASTTAIDTNNNMNNNNQPQETEHDSEDNDNRSDFETNYDSDATSNDDASMDHTHTKETVSQTLLFDQLDTTTASYTANIDSRKKNNYHTQKQRQRKRRGPILSTNSQKSQEKLSNKQQSVPNSSSSTQQPQSIDRGKSESDNDDFVMDITAKVKGSSTQNRKKKYNNSNSKRNNSSSNNGFNNQLSLNDDDDDIRYGSAKSSDEENNDEGSYASFVPKAQKKTRSRKYDSPKIHRNKHQQNQRRVLRSTTKKQKVQDTESDASSKEFEL